MFASYWSSLVRPKRSVNDALAAERLHDAHALEPLLQRAEVGRDAVADVEVGLVRHPPEPAAREEHRRHDHEHAERELPRQHEDHDDRADEQEDVLDEQHEALRDQLLHRVDVGGHAGDDPAGLLGLEVVERQRHEVAEQPVAHAAQEALADPRDEDDRRTGRARRPEQRHARGRRSTAWFSAAGVVLLDRRGRCRTRRAPGRRAARPPAPMSTTAATAIAPRLRPQHAEQALEHVAALRRARASPRRTASPQ